MKKVIFVIFTVFLFSSCEKDEILGPELKTLVNSNLNITSAFTASNSNPDFSAGDKVTFSATLEFEKQWTITIVGNTSGATKTYNGAGANISVNWTGFPDKLPLFRAESVTITLSFAAHPANDQVIGITVAGTPDIDAGGVLVTDFSTSQIQSAGATFGWPSDWPLSTITNTDFPLPDGNAYMYVKETPWQANSPYVDFMNIPSDYAATNYGVHYPLWADPTQVYFNIMVYNDPSTPDTWITLQFKEDGGVIHTYDIRPDWTGWELVSFAYSDLTNENNIAKDPTKCYEITFLLLSDADPLPGGQVTMAIDHPLFTFGKPLILQ